MFRSIATVRSTFALGLWAVLALPAIAYARTGASAPGHAAPHGTLVQPQPRGTPSFPNEGWETRAPMTSGRWAHASAAHHVGAFPDNDAYLYVISGANASFATVATVSRYDVSADTWTDLAPMPQPATQLSAAEIDGRLYVPGGYVGSFSPTSALRIYDIAGDTWSSGPAMPQATGDYAIGEYDDRYIYVVGGYSGTVDLSAVQVYDTVTQTWSLATAKPGAAAAGLRGGIVGNRFVVAAGYSQTLAGPLAQAYVGIIDASDPTVIDWQPIADYPGGPTGRLAAGVPHTLLGDGDIANAVFFTGGDPTGQGTQVRDGTWLYDLDENIWKAGPARPIGVSNINDFVGVASGGELHMVSTGGYDGTAVSAANLWLGLGDETLPDLSIALQSTPASASPDGSLALQFDYASVGAAQDAVITLVVPDGTAYDPVLSDAGWVCTPPPGAAGASCTFSLGDLPNGATGSVGIGLTFVYPTPATQAAAGGIAIEATIASAFDDATPADNSATAFVEFADGVVDVDPISGLVTGEDGSNAQFDMVLSVAPTVDVTVSLTSSDPGEGQPSPTQVVFTPADWSTPRTITVTGIDDGIDDGNVAYTIDGSVASPAGNYGGATVPTVSLTNVALPPVPPRVLAVESVRPVADLGVEPARVPITQLLLRFDQDMAPASISDIASYRLLEAGADGVFGTDACGTVALGDDADVALADAMPGDAQQAIVRIGNLASLPAGRYRLLACDTLTDADGTALDGDGDANPGGEFVFEFAVATTNHLRNPNLDRDLDGWLPFASSGDGVWGVADADASPFSGSALFTGVGTFGAPLLALTQCLQTTDFGAASALVRLSSASADMPEAAMMLGYFDTPDCSEEPFVSALSASVFGDTGGTWRRLRVEAPTGTDGAASIRVFLMFRADAGNSFTADIDNAHTEGALALFADGFEEAGD